MHGIQDRSNEVFKFYMKEQRILHLNTKFGEGAPVVTAGDKNRMLHIIRASATCITDVSYLVMTVWWSQSFLRALLCTAVVTPVLMLILLEMRSKLFLDFGYHLYLL